MTLRQEFEADSCDFMATHATGIKAAGESLNDLANYEYFQNGNLHGDNTSLTAPSEYAQFTEVRAQKNPDKIRSFTSVGERHK